MPLFTLLDTRGHERQLSCAGNKTFELEKSILSVGNPNWTVCALWLDTQSIIALSKLLMCYIMRIYVSHGVWNNSGG